MFERSDRRLDMKDMPGRENKRVIQICFRTIIEEQKLHLKR